MQVVVASHSEVILNEAADRDVVVAFLSQPHRIDDRGSQLLKSLKEIGFGQYYQAEQTGWVLYLEGSTDPAIWRAFAETLERPAQRALERPFVHYTANQPQRARDHFNGLREACADLVGFALFDRLDRPVLEGRPLREWIWTRREIENYLCQPATLLGFALQSGSDDALGPLWAPPEIERRETVMDACIRDVVPPAALRDPADRWRIDNKASDAFLDRVFSCFFSKLGLPNLMRESDYHTLARHVLPTLIDPEVHRVLDAITEVAARARPEKA